MKEAESLEKKARLPGMSLRTGRGWRYQPGYEDEVPVTLPVDLIGDVHAIGGSRVGGLGMST